MSFDLPNTDMVYVSGLPPGASENDLAEYFGSIGKIKLDKKTKKLKIWIYRDRDTGAPKVKPAPMLGMQFPYAGVQPSEPCLAASWPQGDATVSYEDPFSASSAVSWFSGKDWKGARVTSVSGLA
jgi:RNA-binding protein FUS